MTQIATLDQVLRQHEIASLGQTYADVDMYAIHGHNRHYLTFIKPTTIDAYRDADSYAVSMYRMYRYNATYLSSRLLWDIYSYDLDLYKQYSVDVVIFHICDTRSHMIFLIIV